MRGRTVFRQKEVDVRLAGKASSTSHGTRPVLLIITMIKRNRTSRLPIKISLSVKGAYFWGEVSSRVGEGAFGVKERGTQCQWGGGAFVVKGVFVMTEEPFVVKDSTFKMKSFEF